MSQCKQFFKIFLQFSLIATETNPLRLLKNALKGTKEAEKKVADASDVVSVDAAKQMEVRLKFLSWSFASFGHTSSCELLVFKKKYRICLVISKNVYRDYL